MNQCMVCEVCCECRWLSSIDSLLQGRDGLVASSVISAEIMAGKSDVQIMSGLAAMFVDHLSKIESTRQLTLLHCISRLLAGSVAGCL